ncbi:MAG: hypothetical protein ABSC71_14425 [Candidatus Acidiferrales bacterium]
MSDGPIAKETEDAAEQDARHHDAGRSGDAAVKMFGCHEIMLAEACGAN